MVDVAVLAMDVAQGGRRGPSCDGRGPSCGGGRGRSCGGRGRLGCLVLAFSPCCGALFWAAWSSRSKAKAAWPLCPVLRLLEPGWRLLLGRFMLTSKVPRAVVCDTTTNHCSGNFTSFLVLSCKKFRNSPFGVYAWVTRNLVSSSLVSPYAHYRYHKKLT